ncbi:MAG: peptidoglycan DD-metalloendopeptidase family protein [Patescibacteria group bacterium]|nr:peptidoglycan DD-metalloendopeptidase family protein [Patescibacteria group bacterium]
MDFLHKLFTRLKRGILSHTKSFTSEVLMLVLAITVAGLNIIGFNGGKIYTDQSLAAKIVSDNPKLNPQLAEKFGTVKLASQTKPSENSNNNGNFLIKTAYAANLTDDDQSDKKPFEYEVQGGDTLSSIAQQYNLKLNTILWANGLNAKSIIRPGQKLTLLPVDGVLYTIKKGDTIGKIASLYKADSQQIQDYNDIADATKIHAGDMVIIPDGQPLPQASPKPNGTPKTPNNKNESDEDNNPPVIAPPVVSGKLLWPTTTRNLTQKYSATHRGIDISNGAKPPILAAHSGTVEFAGTSGDWGKTILIRGDDGLVTRYSHASEIDVAAGDYVDTGKPIGAVGNTGRVRGRTGLHLDFRL